MENDAHVASPRSRAIATDRAATPAPPSLHLALVPVMPGVRVVGVGPRHTVRRMQGCRDRSRGNGVPRCGILGSVGGGYRPCGRPAPSRHARTVCAEALGLLQAYGSAPHDPTRRSTDPSELDTRATNAGRCAVGGGPTEESPSSTTDHRAFR